MENNQQACITVKDFCARMSISAPTFYRLLKKKQISVLKIGAKTLIESVEVDRFIERCRVKNDEQSRKRA